MKKLNQKGFSLTELLAVAIILGILVTVVTPVISRTLKNNKRSLYNRQLESITESAATWGAEHMNKLPDKGKEVTVTLEELQNGGYADKDLTNPLTSELFDGKLTKVVIRNENGVLKYDVIIE